MRRNCRDGRTNGDNGSIRCFEKRVDNSSGSRMHGTFNGVRLKRILTVIESGEAGVKHYTLRVLDVPYAPLEAVLRLNAAALLILSDSQIEGHIVRYTADRRFGYDITIAAPEPGEKT